MRVGRFLAALPTLTCIVLLGYSTTADASTSTVAGRGGAEVKAVQCIYSSSNLAALRQDGIAPPAAIPSTVGVPIALPVGSAVYGVGFPSSASAVAYTVGPAGYVCAPEYAAADGGEAQYVEEGPRSALGVSSVFEAGGAGPATDLACAYIPAVLAADEVFRAGTGICTHPSGEQVIQIATGVSNRYVAAVEVPASESDPDPPLFGSGKGNVAFALFTAQVSTGQANGQAVSCILPPEDRAICIAALEFFLISQSDVGKQMSASALSQRGSRHREFRRALQGVCDRDDSADAA